MFELIIGNPLSVVLLSSLFGWLLSWLPALLFEYLVLKRPSEYAIKNMRRLGILVVMLFSLVVPVVFLQWFSLRFAEFIGQTYSVPERVDSYANIYALLSLMWGCIWTSFVCRKLYHWLERVLPRQNTQEVKPQ